VAGFIVAPGVSLVGADLRGHNLNGLDLTGVNFSNADLHGTKLEYSTVLRANFKDAKINNSTSFTGSAGRPAVIPAGHRWVSNQLQRI